jgi:hypothetical protein
VIAVHDEHGGEFGGALAICSSAANREKRSALMRVRLDARARGGEAQNLKLRKARNRDHTLVPGSRGVF